MRKLTMAILALAGAATLLMPVREAAYAEVMQKFYRDAKNVSRAANPSRLRTATAGEDPDTVWIGHVYQPSWDGPKNPLTMPSAPFSLTPTMPPGGYGPYHVGRGNNQPTKASGSIGDNGTWDFDRFQPGETDSLQGWWPLARPYTSGGGSKPDFRKSFFCFDYGNQVNYVINQGGPVDANGNKRTFGVTGLWHRDAGSLATGSPDSLGGTNVQPLLWSPEYVGGTGSTASAWMGMRSHGDLSHVDLVANGGTGNPFNSTLMQYQAQYPRLAETGSASATGTDHNFPGYGSQLDQMLYRDIVVGTDTGPLVISFNFSTDMSTLKIAGAANAGWFDKDPLSLSYNVTLVGQPATLDGNFVSATSAGANAPCDSFMVYIGAPVDDNAVLLSNWNGVDPLEPVYDKKRRWFSEVLRLNHACELGNACGIIGKELRSYAGVNAPTAVSIDVGTEFGSAVINDICDAQDANNDGGIVRLVFRVKTNRNSDDENGDAAGFSSGTRGAAILDNVTWTGQASVADGNFESASSIDNKTTTAATVAWKSTGKPPSVVFHTDNIADLDFDDPCGSVDDPKRRCNMYGAVVNGGNHDQGGHKSGGEFGANDQDIQRWFGSPTINLSSSGEGDYNDMGIDADIANPTADYILFGDDWVGDYVNAPSESGEFRSVAFQCYPARQENGNICWSEINIQPTFFYNGAPPGCFPGSIAPGAIENNLIKTSNASGVPDSLRVFIHRAKRCYTFALDQVTCAPTGYLRGAYFDNLSLALIDGAPPPEVSMAIWYLWNDAFPIMAAHRANPTVVTLAGMDTAGAQIRTGANLPVSTGGVDLSRPSISGDSCVVNSVGNDIRLDLVFRILPGPGNYSSMGNRASALLKVPQVPGVNADPVTPGDGDFWGHYMKSAGDFASSSTHGTTTWNKDIWNSARMDTSELNLFPAEGAAELVLLSLGAWSTIYHESDPKYASLGILKNICVMPFPTGTADSDNINCDGTGWGSYGAGSGYDGVTTTTKEYTKIIPDGLLTPGSHVQYFFRKSNLADPITEFEMGPDTNLVFPQPSEANFDGHRWQQFGVLPDRWKDGAWDDAYQNASAPACMLYVDWADRRINELFWVSLADSIGATEPTRFGAHNGWHARGDQDITVEVGTDPSIAVYAHGGQPGTIWDMYGVKASESSTTGSGLGPGTPGAGYQENKDDRRCPTGKMLRYYSVLLLLTGDLAFGNIGPYEDHSNDDLGLITDFIESDDLDDPTHKPRGVWAMGQHFMDNMGTAQPHYSWALSTFGAEVAYILSPTYSQGNYRFESGYSFDVAELYPKPPIQPLSDTNRYSVFNDCRNANDAMFLSGAGQEAGRYPDTPGNPNGETWISSVYAPAELITPPLHEGVTLVEGFDIAIFGSLTSLTTAGRLAYFTKGLTNIFAAMCPAMALGSVSVGGENPNLVNFLALRSENPHRGGDAQLSFGITRKERVELKVYDVTGRLVKVLANREFAAGEHKIFWDGSNEDGRLVPRGVYFYQLRTPSFVSQKKLAVLKH